MPNGLKDRPAATKHESEIRPKGSHSPEVPLSAIGPTSARSSSRARSSPEVDRVAVRIVTDNQVIQFIPSEKRDGLTIERRTGANLTPDAPPRTALHGEWGFSMHVESQRDNEARNVRARGKYANSGEKNRQVDMNP